MIQLMEKFKNANLKAQGLITLISLACYFISSYFLEKSYVLSKFPVPYFEQQTSFDAIKMKEWYAFMLNEGTFDIYFKTQLIDFIFIAAVIVAGFTLWNFIANLHPKQNFFHNWGQIFSYALPLAGVFDIFENLVSFIMIANPEHFSDFWVLPYSKFAVIKFGCWTIGLLWLLVAIIALPFTRFISSKKMAIAGLFMVGLSTFGFSQESPNEKNHEALIHMEVEHAIQVQGYDLY